MGGGSCLTKLTPEFTSACSQSMVAICLRLTRKVRFDVVLVNTVKQFPQHGLGPQRSS